MLRSPAATLAAAWLAAAPVPNALAGDVETIRIADERVPSAAGVGETSTTDGLSITRHSVTIDGARVDYTATVGSLPLAEEDGTVKANVFFVAYTREGVNDPAERPVTYSFNGGPGSSSVWLHLGVLGPRRVLMDDEGQPIGPPYTLVDNAHSVLDLTDLVFIDPVTTGYSRAVPGEDPEQFHGVEEDVEAVGEFIRLYTTRFRRWASPKYLAGESYGTTRAAGLAGHLQERHGMFLNGIILVSAVLDFQTVMFNRGNDMPYLLFLPTCTATAWYHERLAPELQADLAESLREVERFALGEYALALLQGDALGDDRRRQVAERLARYTGLPVEFILEKNLRVTMGEFANELLRDRRRRVGRLDSRFLGMLDTGEGRLGGDPSYAAIQGPYTAMLNDYVRRELGYENDLTYEILTGRVRPWNYGNAENRYLNVADTLRSAMTRNHALRVFVASGYYDFATPYFATDYTFNHLGLDPTLRGNVTIEYYEAGHMMYIHRPSLEKLREDLAGFYGN